MKNQPLIQNQSSNTNFVTVTESQLFEVSGGICAPISKNMPRVDPTPKDPIYITMAIGEGGGKLPDILS
ncbi:hypothetical protein [Alteromonas sp. S015]|uniref:hypothetical protein n=1 Tax=Alteromonas sp. S015 TaxID=3117401 RepID=UPI002FE22306